jgi:hypothetical protein
VPDMALTLTLFGNLIFDKTWAAGNLTIKNIK